MSYSTQQSTNAVAWKRHTTELPGGAKNPSPYVGKDGVADGPARDVCLPPEFAAWNLLPEVRDKMLALFRELHIPWHAGVDEVPSNHLLSSQVQCVNALGQMVDDPRRIERAFGHLVNIGEVLEIEPGRYLTFEYIGPTDFFGEQPSGLRTRGAHCTSVDAAFKHRSGDGAMELVLVEWKYTESYLRPRTPNARADQTRARRYAEFVDDPAGPIRGDVLPFEMLLDEPFYQLVRQQLLAHELEKAGAEGATRVRVLHVLPMGNQAYQDSLPREAHRSLGDSVSEVWSRLLKNERRWSSMDPAVFLDPSITSREYVLRYADDVVWNEVELLQALGAASPGDIEDAVFTEYDFDGDVALDTGGLELICAGNGTTLEYPFRTSDIDEVVNELYDRAAE